MGSTLSTNASPFARWLRVLVAVVLSPLALTVLVAPFLYLLALVVDPTFARSVAEDAGWLGVLLSVLIAVAAQGALAIFAWRRGEAWIARWRRARRHERRGVTSRA